VGALTDGHPVRGAHGALAAPLECHSEPKRHLAGNLGEERAEIPLQEQQRVYGSQCQPDA
jgi:hypothetical protein